MHIIFNKNNRWQHFMPNKKTIYVKAWENSELVRPFVICATKLNTDHVQQTETG